MQRFGDIIVPMLKQNKNLLHIERQMLRISCSKVSLLMLIVNIICHDINTSLVEKMYFMELVFYCTHQNKYMMFTMWKRFNKLNKLPKILSKRTYSQKYWGMKKNFQTVIDLNHYYIHQQITSSDGMDFMEMRISRTNQNYSVIFRTTSVTHKRQTYLGVPSRLRGVTELPAVGSLAYRISRRDTFTVPAVGPVRDPPPMSTSFLGYGTAATSLGLMVLTSRRFAPLACSEGGEKPPTMNHTPCRSFNLRFLKHTFQTRFFSYKYCQLWTKMRNFILFDSSLDKLMFANFM